MIYQSCIYPVDFDNYLLHNTEQFYLHQSYSVTHGNYKIHHVTLNPSSPHLDINPDQALNGKLLALPADREVLHYVLVLPHLPLMHKYIHPQIQEV